MLYANRPRNVAILAVILGTINASAHARAASQLVSPRACAFVEHVPGLFGGHDLRFKVAAGALFSRSGSQKFCGPVAQQTPMGFSKGEGCFVVSGGRFVSGSWSDKVTSSDCALSDAATMHPAFSTDDLSSWQGNGPGTLAGQAFLKTVGGDAKTCAGAQVFLLPATPYVSELLAKMAAGITMRPDPRLSGYTRHTTCDAQGNFSFTGIPTGAWYVLTRVTWGVPRVVVGPDALDPFAALFASGADTEVDQQGGELVKRVTVVAGDNRTLLTSRDQE